MINILTETPRDILPEVFKYLTPEEARNVRATSRRMLGEDPDEILRRLFVKKDIPSEISSDILFEVLTYLTPKEARNVRATSRWLLKEASKNKIWKVYYERRGRREFGGLVTLQTNYFIRYHFEKLENSVDWTLRRYRFLAFQAFGFALSRIPAFDGARHSSALTSIFAEGLCSSLIVMPFTIHSHTPEDRLLPFIHGGMGAVSAMVHRGFGVVPDGSAAFPTMAAFTVSYICTERLMHLTNLRVSLASQFSILVALSPYFTSPLNTCTTLLAAHGVSSIPRDYQGYYIVGTGLALGYIFQPQILPFLAVYYGAINIVECILGKGEPGFFFSLLYHARAYPRWNYLAAIPSVTRGLLLEVSSVLSVGGVRDVAARLLLSPPAIETRWNLWRRGIQLRVRITNAIRRIPGVRAIEKEIVGNIRLFRNIASYLTHS